MNLDDFADVLRDVAPGNFAEVPYDIFADFFPPGIDDDNAKAAAFRFAKEHGCTIDHQPGRSAVRFVKKATPEG